MDTLCVNEEYIVAISSVFKQLYSQINEKKYKELLFNGNIAEKVLKYVEYDLNNHKRVKIEEIYGKIIEDLYLSAYNFCVLSYH